MDALIELDLRRRFFAEEIEAVCKLRTSALVEAFARVPRETFLPSGPWTVMADVDFGGSGIRTRLTPDADPARVYHNIAVAIDPARDLFNGQPATLGVWIDMLELAPGARVLHVGCGTGYYTAVMAHCAGPGGRVVAFEVDAALGAEARRNLAAAAWVDVRTGDASALPGEIFDAILVNAGVTHPLDGWLDALSPRGRLILPLTASMPAMGATLGKGLVFLVAKEEDAGFSARLVGPVAVYSALGVRDPALNDQLGKAMMGGPAAWLTIKRLRRDAHEPSPACWFHAPGFCLSTGA